MLPDRRDPARKCHPLVKEVYVQEIEQKCLDSFPGDFPELASIAVNPQDVHVKLVGCRGGNNKSFSTAPG